MKRILLVLAMAAVMPVAMTAELRREQVPMDRMPTGEPSFQGKDWWERTDIPLDHPYWWTLTDEVTPAELQRRVQDRLLKLQLEAAEKFKRAAKAQSTDRPEPETAWIVSGDETPELFPMWKVLHGFGSSITLYGEAGKKERELIEFGLHPSAAAEIVGVASEAAEKQTELWVETSKQQRKLRALRDEVERAHGHEERQRIFEQYDFEKLAILTSTPLDGVKEMFRLANRRTVAEATIPRMVSLRTAIGEEQWQLLRRYLLRNVAPYMHDSVIFRRPRGGSR